MDGRPARVGLGLVLVALAGALLLGAWEKSQPTIQDGRLQAQCASGDWVNALQYRHLCYSDIVPLFFTEHLNEQNRVPFIDPCPQVQGQQCDEYPVVTMFAMYAASQATSVNGTAGFFFANVVLLSVAAAVTAVGVYLIAGRRALWFALAPTLIIYGFMNWDLLAVALATAATVAFLRKRDVASGILLGLGAATKLYPGLFVIPFAAQRFRERDPDRAIHLTWAAAGAWLAVNLPFALTQPHGWTEFFRFNANRGADWDSLWLIGCHRLFGHPFLTNHVAYCPHTGFINIASIVAFAGISLLVFGLRLGRDPNFPRWTYGLPLLIVFLLTNKVYSPQYGLWLLPWFAVALPDLGRRLSAFKLFVLFELSDIAVFVTRFTFFGRMTNPPVGFHFFFWDFHAPLGAFELAVVIRAIVLVLCLIAWVRQRTVVEGAEPQRALAGAAAGAPA